MLTIRIFKAFWAHVRFVDVRPGALAGHSVSVVLVRPDRSRADIEVCERTHDGVQFYIDPDMQTAIGNYRIELWLDKGTPVQTVADVVNAFCLVPLGTQEGEDEDDCENVHVATISLSQFVSPFVLIEDSLDSDSPTSALSARQGRVLAGMIRDVSSVGGGAGGACDCEAIQEGDLNVILN